MPLIYTDAALAVKPEVAYGTYLAPSYTDTDNSVEIENLQVDAESVIERSTIYAGHEQNKSPMFENEKIVTFSYSVPFRFDTAATVEAVALDTILLAGFGDSMPHGANGLAYYISKNGASYSAKFYKDGIEYIAAGCRNDLEIILEAGKIARVNVKGMGLFQSSSAIAEPTPDYAADKDVMVKDFLACGITNETISKVVLKLNAAPKVKMDIEGRYGVGEIYLDGWDPTVELTTHPEAAAALLLNRSGDTAMDVIVSADAAILGYPKIFIFDKTGVSTTVTWQVLDCKDGADGTIVNTVRNLINPAGTFQFVIQTSA